MLLTQLVSTSDRVAATRSRLAKLRELAACLRALAPDEIEAGVQWLAGETRQGKVGVGYAVVHQAAQVQAASESSLTLHEVDTALSSLQAVRGAGAAARRKSILETLLARATAAEQSFLLRLLVGELRQGALAGLMIDAIAEASNVPLAEVRRAAMYAASVGALARSALLEGSAGLQQFRIQVLSPVAPMLAQTAQSVGEALEQLGSSAAIEWKVDGARVQVHKSGDQVRVYTRNLNDVTAAVPEVVDAVRALNVRDVVLDGETISLDETGRPRPFQTTMRRFGRKLDVASLQAELPLHVYFFDCLLLESASLADRPASERFAAMDRVLPEAIRVPRIVAADVDAAQAFYDDARGRGHEGVMAKSLTSAYEAGNRGAGWLKIKRVHTLDLVVLAAEWGSGRREGWLSNLHLGARDPATGGFVMLGKTFKGLTDAMLEWQTKEFLAREIQRDRYTVHVRPEMVVEIAFNDIQASSQYAGGFALRFARVKAFRPDKTAAEADTIDDIRRIFAAQGG